MKIGNIWNKISKNDNRFLSFSLDEAFLALYPQFKSLSLVAFYIPEKERKSDKSPSYSLHLVLKENKTKEENVVEFAEDDIPF